MTDGIKQAFVNLAHSLLMSKGVSALQDVVAGFQEFEKAGQQLLSIKLVADAATPAKEEVPTQAAAAADDAQAQ